MADNDAVARLRSAGVALRDRGQYEQALARFTDALALDPNDAGIWNNVQLCRARLGDRVGALAAADEMVRLRPDWSRGHYCRAFSLGRLDRHSEAAAAAREAVRLEPDHADNWRCLAQHLRAAGLPDEARAAAQRACELEPTHVDSWIELGRHAHKARDFATADRSLRRALELEPANIEAHVVLVLSLSDQRLHKQAAEHARMALSLDWSHVRTAMPELMTTLAGSLVADGRVDDACDLLRTAIAARPDDDSLRNELVGILIGAKRPAEATAAAREAVAALPTHAASWCNLVRVLDKHSDEAEAAARTATELAPGSSWAWYLYGDCLRARGDLDAAAGAFRRCAQAGPGHEMEQSRVSAHLCELGDPAGALTYAEHGVALSPYAARPHRRRASALLALGRAAEALDASRTATTLDPDDLYNWAQRARIGFYLGAADDARSAAEHATAAAATNEDRNAQHHAAEARGFAAWAEGDVSAAHAAFTEAASLHDTCCCATLGAALTRQPRPAADELADLVAPLSAQDSHRCNNATCPLRATALTPPGGVTD